MTPTKGGLNSRFLEKEVVKSREQGWGELNLYDPKLGRRGRECVSVAN